MKLQARTRLGRLGPGREPRHRARRPVVGRISEYPNLHAMAEMVTTAPGGVPVDFEFGLDLILDGLERLLDTPGH
jgi:Tetracyclin repressor-like, C-terminal domain